MKAYMGGGEDFSEGAALIFANTAKEAKKALVKECRGMLFEEFTEARVKWLRDKPWLFEEADKKLLADGVAHVIDNPRSCHGCEMWGKEWANEKRDYCQDCQMDREPDAQGARPGVRGEGVGE